MKISKFIPQFNSKRCSAANIDVLIRHTRLNMIYRTANKVKCYQGDKPYTQFLFYGQIKKVKETKTETSR